MNNRYQAYQALLQERADLLKETQGIFAIAESEGRALTDAERSRDDDINKRLQAVGTEIQREERRRENERTMAAMMDPNAAAAAKSQIGLHNRSEDDPKRGFAGLGDFALAVKHAQQPGAMVDERLRIGAAPSNYMQEGGTTEGYMVPPAFRQEIWELVFDDSDLLGMVDTEPTSSNQVGLFADEATPWGTSGVLAYWRKEASQMTARKLADLEPRNVVLNELYAMVLASEELLRDNPRLNNRLTKKSAEAIRWKINEGIMNGDGAGKPLGWMKSAALVTVAKEAGQAAATLVPANIAKMYSRVMNPGQSVWLANQDILPQLMTMQLGNNTIWTPPSSGFVNAPGGFLLGRPVQFDEHAETLGTKGDLQLVNPKGYYAATRDSGPQYASSIHLFFDYALEAFRWTFRFAGQPYMSAPVTPAKGASTRSHFVALADRA